MRTIVLRVSEAYRPEGKTAEENYHKALGYLVNWGASFKRIGYVEVSVHTNGDIAASYWTSREQIGELNIRPVFLIFAQLEPNQSYSFNS